MSRITYDTKSNFRTVPLPEEKKVVAANMNEIKESVNALYDITDENVNVAKGVISSAAIIANLGSGIDLIPAPASNILLLPKFTMCQLIYGTTQYTGTNNVGPRYANQIFPTVSDNAWLGEDQDVSLIVQPQLLRGTNLNFAGQAWQLFDDGTPANGDSTIKYYVEYVEIDLDQIT